MKNIGNLTFESSTIKLDKNFLYGLCLFLLCFTYSLPSIYIFSNNNIVNNLNIIIQLITYPCLFIFIINTKYSVKQFYLILIVGMVLFIEFLHNHNTNWIRYFFLFLASQKINFTTILRSLLTAFSSIFLLGIVLYILGISNAGIGRRGASSFGFGQPNILAMIIITLIFLILALKNNINYNEIIIMLLATIFITVFLKTRTATVLLLLFPVIYFWAKRGITEDKKISKLFMEASQLIIFGFTCLLLYLYPKPIYNRFRNIFDILFTYRPYLNYNNVMQYGISLFGQNVKIMNTSNYAFNYFEGTVSNQKYNTVDSAYVTELIVVGLITMIPMLIFYIKMIKKAIINHRYMIVTIAIMCCLYAFVENNYVEAYYFFPFFYLMSIDNLPLSKTVNT